MTKVNVPGLIKDHHKRTSRDDDKDPHLLHLGTSEAEVPVNTPSSVPNAYEVGSAPVPVWTWYGRKFSCFGQELNLDFSAVQPVTLSLC